MMSLDQLMARYFRLKQELSIAYKSHPWHSARIDRLADEIVRTELEIASMKSVGQASMAGLQKAA